MSQEDLLPRPEEEEGLARRLRTESHKSERRILALLTKRPHLHAELDLLLEDGSPSALEAALTRLRFDGLIDQRIGATKRPPVKQYELTELGRLIASRLDPTG